jgi:uncharacterized protein YkwD
MYYKNMNYSFNESTGGSFVEWIKDLVLPSEKNNFRSKIIQSNFLFYCVVLILALRIITTLASINIPQNIFFADINKSALESFVNETRQSQGLQPLSENEQLDQAAQLKAENMVQDNYFDHTSPTGITPWFWFLKVGYKYKYAGENLAIGFFDSQEVYDAWLNSPSHKANIVNPNYTEVVTAILSGFGQGNTIVVVQEFGSQQPVKTPTVKNNTPKVSTSVKTQTPNTQAVKTQTTNNQTLTKNSAEKVLSQSTQSQSLVQASKVSSSNNLASKALNSVLYNYDALLQDIIYGVSLVVIGILLTLILFNFNISFKKQLVFRAVLIVALLSAATLFNKELVTSIIPHQMFI